MRKVWFTVLLSKHSSQTMSTTQKQKLCLIHGGSFIILICIYLFFTFYLTTVKMTLCWWFLLVAFIPMTSGTNPGVKVKLTEKGLEYGRVSSNFPLLVEKCQSLQSFHHHVFLCFVRQTTGHGFNSAETQIHQSPRFFRVTDSFSYWQCQVQLVKVRMLYI